MDIIAHNQFRGIVTKIDRGETHSLVNVDVAPLSFVSLVTTHELDKLGIGEGSAVTVGVRSSDVMIAVEKSRVPISADNQFQGSIVQVERGDVATEALFKFKDDESKELLAIMPNDAAEKTEVVAAKHSHVLAVIRATDVSLATDCECTE